MNPPGLRERKKAKTRSAIQRAALRLIAERGYEATTVDQIAAEAEVSPATVFRYFPTKEDIILQDEYDPLIIQIWQAEQPGGSPIAAARRVIAKAFAQLGPDEMGELRERTKLIFMEPQLRARSLDNWAQSQEMIAELIAAQSGRSAEELPVRLMVGAMLGSWIAAIEYWTRHPEIDLLELMDAGLAQLEHGARL